MPMSIVTDIPTLLQQHGIQPTSQRLELAELSLSQHQHFSADQILERANDQGSIVSRATVYNTLNLFVEKGLLKEILIDPARVLYDSNTDVHHHTYNTDTGVLRDIECVEFSVSQLPVLRRDEILDSIELIFKVKNKS